MKLHILSDLHRDLAGGIDIPDTDADVVILAGDIDGGFETAIQGDTRIQLVTPLRGVTGLLALRATGLGPAART